MPKVSVIIPTYNAEKYICEAVESALAQTYRDFEIIVIDDGSKDNTRQILNQYGNKIKYIYQDNKGVSAARNKGIREARGEHVALLDADDIWFPDKLMKQVAIAKENPEVDLIFSDVEFFNDSRFLRASLVSANFKKYEVGSLRHNLASVVFNNGAIFKGNFYKDLILGCLPVLSTVFIRKKCLEKVGYFDENLNIAEDYDLWMRIAMTGTFLYLNSVTTRYRVRDDSSSGPVNIRYFLYKSHEAKVLEKQLHICPKSYKNLIRTKILEFYKSSIWAYYNLKELNKVRSLCLCSLRYNIFQGKLYLYLFASFLPAGFIKPRTPLEIER